MTAGSRLSPRPFATPEWNGLRQTPEMIVDAAIQEDVDAVGISILSGAHMTLFPAILDEIKKRGADDMLVFGGGIIPDEDIEELEKMGVAKIFTPARRPRMQSSSCVWR